MDLLKQIKLGQYTYKLGIPLYQDTEYDEMVREYTKVNPEKEINLNWEDITDEEGISLLNEYGIGSDYSELMQLMGETAFPQDMYVKNIPASKEVVDRYLAYKPMSNKSMPIVTESEQFLKLTKHMVESNIDEVILSLKLDGWNITLYIEEGKIVYAHTRGRQSEVKDVTEIMKVILSKKDINLSRIKQGFIVGELILKDRELIPLRIKYRKKFKTTRNSISSFINNTVIAEDLPRADFVAFRLNFVDNNFEKQSDRLETLSNMGFEIPLYITCDCSPESILVNFISMSNRINTLPPSDGVVVQPNTIEHKQDLNQLAIFASSYETGLYALKMANWGPQVLKTTIVDIITTRNTKTIKPSLVIEPVKSRDGREITVVPIDHIGRLVDEDLYIGKEISLTVVSEQDIRLMYNEDKARLRTNA